MVVPAVLGVCGLPAGLASDELQAPALVENDGAAVAELVPVWPNVPTRAALDQILDLHGSQDLCPQVESCELFFVRCCCVLRM